MDNQEARGILANLEADYKDLDPLVLTNDSIQIVNKRIEALGIAISALQAQNVPDTDGDMINRQAAIDAKQEFRNPNVVRNTEARTAYDRTYANGWNDCNSAWINAIKALPPVTPKRKTGKWIEDRCSECGCYVYHGDVRNFCPMCGADLRGDQDG